MNRRKFLQGFAAALVATRLLIPVRGAVKGDDYSARVQAAIDADHAEFERRECYSVAYERSGVGAREVHRGDLIVIDDSGEVSAWRRAERHDFRIGPQ